MGTGPFDSAATYTMEDHVDEFTDDRFTDDRFTERQQRILVLLEDLNNRLADLSGRVSAGDIASREWWAEKDACERKGVSHSVLRKPENRRYLPNHGLPARILSNGRYKNMYHWSWVAEWLPMDQAAIDEALHRGAWLERVDDDGRVLSYVTRRDIARTDNPV